MRFSKWIATVIILMNATFTTAVLYIFMQVGDEPSVLIGAWFAFTTGELWALASIRKSKAKQGKGENQL